MRIVRASDQAFLIVFDDRITSAAGEAARGLHRTLSARPVPGQIDLHPAYASLLVRFDAIVAAPEEVESAIRRRLEDGGVDDAAPRTIEVPVRYGGVDGPDLESVAQATGLPPDEVVAAHAEALYRVCFVGFSPGFPYLEGLPERLATPRHPAPRRRVPAGSVAIAGAQAGIYPLATAGGWNLIGRTDLVLFDARRNPVSLLAAGDRVRFVPIGGRE